MSISRRVFMKSGGLALFSFGLDPLFLARAAFASYRPLPPIAALSRPVLVCLFQRGAVDGLNMVVPHGESLYYRERPRIAVPASDVVDLDGHFGLHPQLAALKPLWDNKSLGVIHAVGSPDSTRSHFDAQDYMESGTPGVKSTADGWLNRYCRHDREHDDTPFRGVGWGGRCSKSRSSSRGTWACRWRSRTSPGGTRTSTRAGARGSWPRASPSWVKGSRRSPRTSGTGCATSWCSRCPSSAARSARTATLAPTMATPPRCW